MVAKGFLGCDDLLVYDSLTFEPCNRKHVLGSIASLISNNSTKRTFCVKSCQKQRNGHDCGVFAIAFSVALANGQDPSSFFFDTKKMRSHLRECFSKNEFSLFPITSNRGVKSKRGDKFYPIAL